MATAAADPIAWALDASGDREILTTTGCRFTTGLEAVRQNIETALQVVEGEWFLDLERGVPLYTEIMGERFDKAKILKVYRDIIEAVPDVTEVIVLTASFNGITREASVYFEALTPFGAVTGTN